MTRVAPTVPAETDLLCEGCGYTLNGLPEDSRCPECGRLIAESAPEIRQLPEWESTGRSFLATTWAVLTRPAHFYRTFTTRWGNAVRAARFSSWHLLVSSLMFTLTALLHLEWMLGLSVGRAWERGDWLVLAVGTLGGTLITFFFLKALTVIAAYLTAWEAAYRGLRLNYPVVLRGMQYHAAHYLPVAVIATATVIVFQWLMRHDRLPPSSAIWYLYTLSAEVVAGAVYLFWTYWIGMRNMMYANR
jgi:hypothetical protein